MSTVEIIEEYRALWAQAQQENQFTQALLGAVMGKSDLSEVRLSQSDIQDTVNGYRLRVDGEGTDIVVALEKVEDDE